MINMLINPPSSRQQIDSIQLPSQTDKLLQLFQESDQHLVRVCTLAKVRQQLVSSLPLLPQSSPDPSTSAAVEELFTNTILQNFTPSLSPERSIEQRILYHLVSLAIKYYFSEDGFKYLIKNVIQLIGRWQERVRPAFIFFIQIIQTIQISDEEEKVGQKTKRCLFEGYLWNHIIQMLDVANYYLECYLIPSEVRMQDKNIKKFGFFAPEENIALALKLVRTCLCFDRQRANPSDDESGMNMILLPYRKNRHSQGSKFQKWLQNKDWLRLYLYIYQNSKSIALKIEVVKLFGNLTRIHLPFFGQETIYRAYLQFISYSYIQIIDSLQIYSVSNQMVQLILAIANSLNNLMIPLTQSHFFNIGRNIWQNLLESVGKFIINQIIDQDIFNVNIIYYFFNFFERVLKGSLFSKDKQIYEVVEQIMRNICRNYQQYIRTLLMKIDRPITTCDSSCHRQDLMKFKDCLSNYDWRELQIFMLPFRMMRPRFSSTNNVNEFFLLTLGKFTRSTNTLETFKLEQVQKQIATSTQIQSINNIKKWFGFTSFKKRVNLDSQTISNASNRKSLQSINQSYDEEIQNEQKYCHMLRLCAFTIIDMLVQRTPIFIYKLSSASISLVSLTLELCLCADLQQKDSQQRNISICWQKLEEGLEMCPLLCKKILLRQYERLLYLQTLDQYKPLPVRYKKDFLDYQLEYIDYELENENYQLLTLLRDILPTAPQSLNKSLVEITFLVGICLPSELASLDSILLDSFQSCLTCMEVISSMEILTHLIRYESPALVQFIIRIYRWLEHRETRDQRDLLLTIRILGVLAGLRVGEASEEATNKLFMLIRLFLSSVKNGLQVGEQIKRECQHIAENIFSNSRQLDFLRLSQQVREVLWINQKKYEPMDIDTNCLSLTIDTPQTQHKVYHQHQVEKTGEKNAWMNLSEYKNEEKHIFDDIEKVQIYDGFNQNQVLSLVDKYILEETTAQLQDRGQVEEQQSWIIQKDSDFMMETADSDFVDRSGILNETADKLERQQFVNRESTNQQITLQVEDSLTIQKSQKKQKESQNNPEKVEQQDSFEAQPLILNSSYSKAGQQVQDQE